MRRHHQPVNEQIYINYSQRTAACLQENLFGLSSGGLRARAQSGFIGQHVRTTAIM